MTQAIIFGRWWHVRCNLDPLKKKKEKKTEPATYILTMVSKASSSCCCCKSSPQATHSPWQSQRAGVKKHPSRATRHHTGIFMLSTARQAGGQGRTRAQQRSQSAAGESGRQCRWDLAPAYKERSEPEWQQYCINSISFFFLNPQQIINWICVVSWKRWWWKSVQPTSGDGRRGWGLRESETSSNYRWANSSGQESSSAPGVASQIGLFFSPIAEVGDLLPFISGCRDYL